MLLCVLCSLSFHEISIKAANSDTAVSLSHTTRWNSVHQEVHIISVQSSVEWCWDGSANAVSSFASSQAVVWSVRRRHVHFHPIMTAVPQWSILGPILFFLCMVDLVWLTDDSGLHPHIYADDTQIYWFCSPRDMMALADRMVSYISNKSAFSMDEVQPSTTECN